jgi:DNA polymerase-4
MSHQHVLEPALRSISGAAEFSRHLLAKAGERLRRNGYYCSRLALHLAFEAEYKDPNRNNWGNWSGWGEETRFPETQNTDYLLARLKELWAGIDRSPHRHAKPVKVGVVLLGLVPLMQHQPDLFAPPPKEFLRPIPRRTAPLNHLMDEINAKYGRNTIGFGMQSDALRRKSMREFTGHAAFQRVPDLWEF